MKLLKGRFDPKTLAGEKGRLVVLIRHAVFNDSILCCDLVAHAMVLLETVESVKNVDVDS